MPEKQWVGQRGCKNYGGVDKVVTRVCCGGVLHKRIRLKCDVHKRVYADICRKAVCGYYEKGVRKCPKKK
jgi:hypothetical protein